MRKKNYGQVLMWKGEGKRWRERGKLVMRKDKLDVHTAKPNRSPIASTVTCCKWGLAYHIDSLPCYTFLGMCRAHGPRGMPIFCQSCVVERYPGLLEGRAEVPLEYWNLVHGHSTNANKE
jgi:hypothetical protein